LLQVRRKRVARDYQLVARFYRENPIVQIGFGAKVSPQKISNQVKAVKKGDGPKKELIEALRSFNQFLTAQEFHQVRTKSFNLFYNYTTFLVQFESRFDLDDKFSFMTYLFYCFHSQFQFVNTLCVEKELKIRIKELIKYRDHGLIKQSQLVPFEQLRFRREIRLKRLAKLKAGGGGSGSCTPVPAVPARFLPQPGDYSLKVRFCFTYSS
jgi:hypothetical protein